MEVEVGNKSIAPIAPPIDVQNGDEAFLDREKDIVF
jgi:hypothetical protein